MNRPHPAAPRRPDARAILTALGVVLAAPAVLAQEAWSCGPLTNGFGPYDYRTERGNSLMLVEGAHFTPEVEALIRGNSGKIGGDLDYVLRAYPNHHRALLTTMRLGEKFKTDKPPDMRYTVDCWFQRAVRFKQDDTTVRLLYATFLNKNGRPQEAYQQVDRVIALAPDNAFTLYNAGMVSLEFKQYDKARQLAHRAAALGFLRPELRDQLKAVGKWSEPPAAPSAAASGTSGTTNGAAPAIASTAAADGAVPSVAAGTPSETAPKSTTAGPTR